MQTAARRYNVIATCRVSFRISTLLYLAYGAPNTPKMALRLTSAETAV